MHIGRTVRDIVAGDEEKSRRTGSASRTSLRSNASSSPQIAYRAGRRHHRPRPSVRVGEPSVVDHGIYRGVDLLCVCGDPSGCAFLRSPHHPVEDGGVLCYTFTSVPPVLVSEEHHGTVFYLQPTFVKRDPDALLQFRGEMI